MIYWVYYLKNLGIIITIINYRVLTECSMHSIIDLYDDYDFLRSFMSSPIINKLIINSNILKDILSEIGDLGGNFIQIDIQKDNNLIIFSTDGVLGKCEVELSTIGDNLLNYESYASQIQKYYIIFINIL